MTNAGINDKIFSNAHAWAPETHLNKKVYPPLKFNCGLV